MAKYCAAAALISSQFTSKSDDAQLRTRTISQIGRAADCRLSCDLFISSCGTAVKQNDDYQLCQSTICPSQSRDGPSPGGVHISKTVPKSPQISHHSRHDDTLTCKELRLKGIIFGGRLPSWHRRVKQFASVEDYVQAVQDKKARDQVLSLPDP